MRTKQQEMKNYAWRTEIATIFNDMTANAGFTSTLGKTNNEDLNAQPIPEPKLMRATELKVSIE